MNLLEKPIKIITNHTLQKSEVEFDYNNVYANEPLVDIADFNIKGECFYAIDDGSNYPYCKKIADSKKVFLRKTVVEKLLNVNKQLFSLGLELYVFDGWRSIKTQKALWVHFLNEAKVVTKSSNIQKLEKFALGFCSNPNFFDKNNFKTCPVHATGGSVDLTLIRIDEGDLLDMGSGFDEASLKSSPDWFEKNKNHIKANKNICYNRRIIFNSMCNEGFVFHPKEWWHFDYGNILWAAKTEKKAFYGYVEK